MEAPKTDQQKRKAAAIRNKANRCCSGAAMIEELNNLQ